LLASAGFEEIKKAAKGTSSGLPSAVSPTAEAVVDSRVGLVAPFCVLKILVAL